jgi:hypothetical protein
MHIGGLASYLRGPVRPPVTRARRQGSTRKMGMAVHRVFGDEEDVVPDTNLTQGFLERTGEVSAPKKVSALSNHIGEGTGLERTRAILAYMITGGFFSLLLLLIFLRPPDSNLAMLNIVLGSLGTAWLGAMAYFFGATASHRTGNAQDSLAYRHSKNVGQ